MHNLTILIDGMFSTLELLAVKQGTVLWACAPDYKRLLYVSGNYRDIWKRDANELYKDITVWKNYLALENKDQVYQKNKSRNSLINPKHTQIYCILLPDQSTQWILDRTFNITNANNETIMVAGVALPIKKHDLENESNHPASDILDKYVLNYYRVLVAAHQSTNKNSDFYKKIDLLSKREKQILEHILYGLTGEQIAKKLYISRRTVEAHTSVIKEKFNCQSKSEIISKAIEMRCIHVLLPK